MLFVSPDSALTGDVGISRRTVFAYNVVTKAITRVTPNGGAAASWPARLPVTDLTGRMVAFEKGGNGSYPDVYQPKQIAVIDRTTGKLTIASPTLTQPDGWEPDRYMYPVMSADGRWVGYVAHQELANAPRQQARLHDLWAGTSERLAVTATGGPTSARRSWISDVSPGARHVVFGVESTEDLEASEPAGAWNAAYLRAFGPNHGAPATDIVAAPGGTVGPRPTVEFASKQLNTGFQCRVDNAAWVSCRSPYTWPRLSSGAHILDVRARDAHGLVDSSPARLTIWVDATAPNTTIKAGPKGSSADRTPALRVASTESSAIFEYRVDKGKWKRVKARFSTSTLKAGRHTVFVRSADRFGNIDPTPAKLTFSVR